MDVAVDGVVHLLFRSKNSRQECPALSEQVQGAGSTGPPGLQASQTPRTTLNHSAYRR